MFYPQIISKAKIKKNIYNPNIPSLTILGSADTNYSILVNMYKELDNKMHKLIELEFQPHAFLNSITNEEKNIIFDSIDKFIK